MIDNDLLEKENEATNFFEIFDTDKSGYISFSEFYNVLRCFGITRNKYEVREMFDEIDANKNNLIEHNEIIRYFNSTINYNDINNIIDAFYLIDTQQKGYITLNDLLVYIKKTCIKISSSKIIDNFNEEDVNNDEKISINEFIYIAERNHKITNLKLIIDLLVFVNKIETKNLIDPKCKKDTYEKYDFLKKNSCFFKSISF